MYYKKRVRAKEEEEDADNDCIDGRQQWLLVALVPINQPDNFNCLI